MKPAVSAKTSGNQEEWDSPERRGGIGSQSGSSHGHPPIQVPHTVEDEEEEIIKTMPWIKVE